MTDFVAMPVDISTVPAIGLIDSISWGNRNWEGSRLPIRQGLFEWS